ncbi:hypothetical protein HPP92_025014 [Vanilla planifolia]|uniref:Uncharacterized protein n=1 Tax=Vanilla planifolia TaxID=51239 RepID=A0A835U8Z1_VANPL|nr:hypothetical protein HPP92_025014 [Vanilla planifolia]
MGWRQWLQLPVEFGGRFLTRESSEAGSSCKKGDDGMPLRPQTENRERGEPKKGGEKAKGLQRIAGIDHLPPYHS